MLQTVAPVIGHTKVMDLRSRLGAGGGEAIAAEWEIAVVYCLSCQGQIEAINSREGVREPDILYVSSDGSRVAIEVTALSDRSYHDKSPMRAFSGELLRITFKHGIQGWGAIHYEIGSTHHSDGPVLVVPSRREMAGFFASGSFLAFVANIKSAPTSPSELAFQVNGARSRLKFVPGIRFGGGTYANVNLPVDVRNSPVSSRLKAKDGIGPGGGISSGSTRRMVVMVFDSLSEHDGRVASRVFQQLLARHPGLRAEKHSLHQVHERAAPDLGRKPS
jgi:hypothetical protein